MCEPDSSHCMASGCEAHRGWIYPEPGLVPVVSTSAHIVMLQSWERATGPTGEQWETCLLIYILLSPIVWYLTHDVGPHQLFTYFIMFFHIYTFNFIEHESGMVCTMCQFCWGLLLVCFHVLVCLTLCQHRYSMGWLHWCSVIHTRDFPSA